jgi:hypothetical protein
MQLKITDTRLALCTVAQPDARQGDPEPNRLPVRTLSPPCKLVPAQLQL